MTLNRRSQTASLKKRNLITYSNPNSVISDQFRTIRTNIEFLTEKNKKRLFLITSPGSGEGKSTTTANLAVSMAQQKEKVLLIDANLREPIIHHIFKVPNEDGLTSVLKGKIKFDDAVHRTGIGNLDVITSGETSFNPAELLGKEMMSYLLDMAASTYNIVLIDSPPVLTSTETRVLANRSDGVVLVLNRGKTQLQQATEARRILELANANLVGAIITEKR